jgi:hypothetical protein
LLAPTTDWMPRAIKKRKKKKRRRITGCDCNQCFFYFSSFKYRFFLSFLQYDHSLLLLV